MQAEVPHEQLRVNGNTHVKINLIYLAEVFFSKFYVNIIGDIVNGLLAVVYFRTRNLNNTDEQILLQNSIIAILISYAVDLSMRFTLVANATRYYGQNLRIIDVEEKITFVRNKIYITCSVVLGVLLQIPRIPLFYYFIPLTKSTMCDLYGPANCDMLKAICVVDLIITCVFGTSLLLGLMILPTYLTGILKDIATFVRDNMIGLLYGNAVNSLTFDVGID